MMRSLYSGVSGLQVNQIRMDVVANNIANVNTVGFKKGQVTFQDMLSQNIAGAKAGEASTTGGVAAQQIGLGARIGSINNIHTQGAVATTGNSTDIMIQGNGYFILQEGEATYYSRAGNFTLDNSGNLVNSANGMLVCDENGTAINITGSMVSIGPDGTISFIDSSGNPTTSDSKLGIATFPNSQGLTKAGENMYIASEASGEAVITTPGTNAGSLISGALEMSNVDMAQEMVDMIITQRAYQANSRTIRTADEMLQELLNIKR